MIMYDETEYFQNWDHPLFDYPYTLRNNKLASFKIGLTFNDSDYSFVN